MVLVQCARTGLEEYQTFIAFVSVLSYYKPGERLEVQCDSSQTGLGAALMKNRHPIAYTSRALTETECRYAQIEKKMLLIGFAM